MKKGLYVILEESFCINKKEIKVLIYKNKDDASSYLQEFINKYKGYFPEEIILCDFANFYDDDNNYKSCKLDKQEIL